MSTLADQSFLAAVRLHRAGDVAAAERQYRETLDLCGADGSARGDVWFEANHNLGRLLLGAGRLAEAVPYLQRAHHHDSDNQECRRVFGAALLSIGRVFEAAEILGEGAPERDATRLNVVARQCGEGMTANADALLQMLDPYSPNSSGGDARARLELALVGANRLPMLLAQLAGGDRSANGAAALPIESICREPASRAAAARLAELFNMHGSDKARPTHHNYHELYGFMLRAPETVTAVLEIGLGTNNADVVSSMLGTGRTGASLRAFRDFLPRADIYGADIDKRVLFAEDRIATFFVDQTDQLTFDALAPHLPAEMDLIIDDGLHSPDANVTVLLFALPRIKRGGWFVVEDIKAPSLPVWRIAAALMPPGYVARIVKARVLYMFVVERLKDGGTSSLPVG